MTGRYRGVSTMASRAQDFGNNQLNGVAASPAHEMSRRYREAGFES